MPQMVNLDHPDLVAVADPPEGTDQVPGLDGQADLYWRADGQNIAVLLDGSLHDDPTVAALDANKRRLLRDAGFIEPFST